MSRPVRRNYPRRGLSIEDYPENSDLDHNDLEDTRPGRSRLPRYNQTESAISERSHSISRPTSSHNVGRPSYTRSRSRGAESERVTSTSQSREHSRSRIPTLILRDQPDFMGSESFDHDDSRFIATPSPAVVSSPHHDTMTESEPDISYNSPAPYLSPMIHNFGMYRTHRSGDSSHPIPSSWGSGPEQHPAPLGDSLSIDDESSHTLSEQDEDSDDDETESHVSNHEFNSQSSLARQASVMKLSRPSITNIKSIEKAAPAAPSSSWLTSQDTIPNSRPHMANVTSFLDSETAPSVPGTYQQRGFLESATDGSSVAAPVPLRMRMQQKALYADGRKSPRPIMPSTFESRHEKILGRDVPSGPLPTVTKEEDETLADLPGRLPKSYNRPPTVRGSTTSLPELIRRATNLAQALEKGRPSSRMKKPGTVGLGDGTIKEEADGLGDPYYKTDRDSDDLSDMLGAFPTPSKGRAPVPSRKVPVVGSTPLAQEVREPRRSRFSMKAPTEGDGRKSRARCCGLPRWLFLLILLIALIIIAIAIVVPLQLVVLNKNTAAPVSINNTTTTTNAPCTLSCQNGGTLNNGTGTCSCSCVGGFVGDNCSVYGNPGCQPSDPNGASYKNATVGNALPRIFETSKTDFNLTLDINLIFQEFTKKNSSCTLENALVSFNGYTSPTSRRRLRRGMGNLAPIPKPQALPEIIPRAYTTVTVGPGGGAPTPTASSGATGTSTYSAPTAQTTTKVPQRAVDFCRSAVLLILELSGFDVATSAQSIMQAYMLQDTYPSPLQIGAYYTIDFRALSLTTQNGTVVGGLGSG